MPVYAATIFLSAFLLFQVQPMIAKFILPWFGGSAAVWSAVLLFFQLLLLAGYFYAHLLIRYAKPVTQFWIHAALLTVTLVTLPIIPAAHWKPTGGDDPTWRILLVLGATVGLPYTLLAATSPLLQAWFVRTHTGAIPYRLFALSNFGSMLALLSYPFGIEPYLSLGHQAWIWSILFGAFAVLCAFAAWKSRVGDTPVAAATVIGARAQVEDRPTVAQCLLWIGLAACASALLLAVTSHLTQNVAPIPLLWIAPLSLYLLSFILCFEGRLYYRPIWLTLFIGALGTFAVGNYLYEQNYAVVNTLIPALCGALFVSCMVCHGELARSKPHPRYLTEFYLMVSIGGAVGGLFVALIAPRVFNTFLELPVAIAVAAILVAGILSRDTAGRKYRAVMQTGLAMGVVGLVSYLTVAEVKSNRDYLFSARNFYGVLRVRDQGANGDYPGERVLIHGTINHGTQVNLPGSERIATSYFGEESGINRAVRALHERGPLHLGILGLGAGVTATLANAGDTLHYYEINPLVVDIAKQNFGFWNACPADKTLFMGDGRLSLEKIGASENLDFLAMDAFTSDAVPVHLLTREAYEVYMRHLRKDGVLAINISNRYLDLEPVVAQAASDLGFTGVVVPDEGETESFYTGSTWVLMSRDPAIFEHANLKGTAKLVAKPGFRVWTDDFSNIIKILKK
jgi:spermidine synthase